MPIPPLQWTPSMDALVGTDSDDAIGRQLGISGSAVWKRRHQRGLPPAIRANARGTNPSATLKGGIYAAERAVGRRTVDIARSYGIHVNSVRQSIQLYRARVAKERRFLLRGSSRMATVGT